ncbi:419_t:CDS:2, partial [Racocetra persica]
LEVRQESSNIAKLETSNKNEERIAIDDSESKESIKEESAKKAEKLFLEIEEIEVSSNKLL